MAGTGTQLQSEALLEAVRAGDTQRVKHLLDQEPGLARTKDADGASAILLALYHNHGDLVPLFLQHVDLDFHEACAAGRRDRVEYLLARDPTLVNQHSPDGYPPLGLAVFFGHEGLARYLLDHGADVNTQSKNGQNVSPLHAAAARRNAVLVRMLLDHAADPNARQAHDYTPLHTAAFHGDTEIAELLIERGADPRMKSTEGKTPADMAAERGHAGLAARLGRG
jgi:ankyrin repeat protein